MKSVLFSYFFLPFIFLTGSHVQGNPIDSAGIMRKAEASIKVLAKSLDLTNSLRKEQKQFAKWHTLWKNSRTMLKSLHGAERARMEASLRKQYSDLKDIEKVVAQKLLFIHEDLIRDLSGEDIAQWKAERRAVFHNYFMVIRRNQKRAQKAIRNKQYSYAIVIMMNSFRGAKKLYEKISIAYPTSLIGIKIS